MVRMIVVVGISLNQSIGSVESSIYPFSYYSSITRSYTLVCMCVIDNKWKIWNGSKVENRSYSRDHGSMLDGQSWMSCVSEHFTGSKWKDGKPKGKPVCKFKLQLRPTPSYVCMCVCLPEPWVHLEKWKRRRLLCFWKKRFVDFWFLVSNWQEGINSMVVVRCGTMMIRWDLLRYQWIRHLCIIGSSCSRVWLLNERICFFDSTWWWWYASRYETDGKQQLRIFFSFLKLNRSIHQLFIFLFSFHFFSFCWISLQIFFSIWISHTHKSTIYTDEEHENAVEQQIECPWWYAPCDGQTIAIRCCRTKATWTLTEQTNE